MVDVQVNPNHPERILPIRLGGREIISAKYGVFGAVVGTGLRRDYAGKK